MCSSINDFSLITIFIVWNLYGNALEIIKKKFRVVTKRINGEWIANVKKKFTRVRNYRRYKNSIVGKAIFQHVTQLYNGTRIVYTCVVLVIIWKDLKEHKVKNDTFHTKTSILKIS